MTSDSATPLVDSPKGLVPAPIPDAAARGVEGVNLVVAPDESGFIASLRTTVRGAARSLPLREDGTGIWGVRQLSVNATDEEWLELLKVLDKFYEEICNARSALG